MEEPGNDTNRYDLLCPTVVKPKYQKFDVQEDEEISADAILLASLEKQPLKSNDDAIASYYEEVPEIPYEIGIVREFPFTSSHQCMSVITRTLGADHMSLYCKGAPEKIKDLCIPDSCKFFVNHRLFY